LSFGEVIDASCKGVDGGNAGKTEIVLPDSCYQMECDDVRRRRKRGGGVKTQEVERRR